MVGEEEVDDVEVVARAAVELDNDAVLDHEWAAGRSGRPSRRGRGRVGRDQRLAPQLALGSRSARARPVGGHVGEQQLALASRRGRAADEGGGLVRAYASSRRAAQRSEVVLGRAVRPQRGVDLEDLVVGHAGELGRALEVLGQRRPAGCVGHRGLAQQRLRRRAQVGGVDAPVAQRLERDLGERVPPGVATRSGRWVPSG